MTRARDVANLIGSGNYSSTTFTATAGQTAFTISHTQGFVQVFMNGLLLDETVDYTSNGSAVTLTSGAAAGDEIEVVAYNTFSVGDAVSKSGGAMTGALTVDAAGATVLTLDRATSDGTIIDVQKDGSTVGSIGVDNSDNLYIQGNSSHAGIQFGTNSAMPHTNGNTSDNAEDLGTSNTRWKDLYLSGGAYIGGTGAANYLDDYEEGTWTATAQVGSLTAHATPTYTKVGDLVTIYFDLRSFTEASSTDYVKINGLPFTSTKRSVGALMFRYWDTEDDGIVAYVDASIGYIQFLAGSSANWNVLKYSQKNGGSAILAGTITYKVS